MLHCLLFTRLQLIECITFTFAVELTAYSLRFNGHFSTWTWVSRYQNVSILDFIRAMDNANDVIAVLRQSSQKFKITKPHKIQHNGKITKEP